MLTSAWVGVGRELRAYAIREDGTAKFVAPFSMLPADIPEGRLVAVGELLALEVNGRIFAIVTDTCDYCHASVEGGVTSCGRVFCDETCREEFAWNHG
jgi:hypothetical protein